MNNLHEILEKARASRQRLQPNEAAVLFAAAVRLAAAQGHTLRARLVQIDDSGVMHLLPFEDQGPEIEPGYLAPELMGADAPRKSEPRVQVFAAGALGFELLTGHVPPGNLAELSGPLGDIVRMALAPDRRERFGDLTQLQDAVEGVQPRPPAEGERNIFAALRTRWSRPPPEKEALARLIEKLRELEQQVSNLSKMQARLDAAQRDAAERFDRFEGGTQRKQAPPPSAWGPALISAALAVAAVVGMGWALGVAQKVQREPPAVAAPLPALPAPVPALPAPVPVSEPDASVAEAPKPAADAGLPALVAAEPPDAGPAAAATASDAGETAQAPADAGAAQAASEPAAPPKKRKPPEVSQAAMLHAVAISQVRRGDSALEQGRADEALESFRAALENEPNLAIAHRGLGMAYAMQGNDQQALASYQKYLQLAPAAADKADIRKSIAELKGRSKIGGGEK